MELHAPCMSFPPSSKALATLCFVNMRKGWDARITERLDELSALYHQTAKEDRRLQKKRCEAAAAALTYIRLFVRSETLK